MDLRSAIFSAGLFVIALSAVAIALCWASSHHSTFPAPLALSAKPCARHAIPVTYNGTGQARDAAFDTDCANVFLSASGKTVRGDPATFREIQYDDPLQEHFLFAEDLMHVYYFSSEGANDILTAANPKTFEVVGEGFDADVYSRDNKHVYWYSSIVPGADLFTFKVVTVEEKNVNPSIYMATTTYDALDRTRFYDHGEAIVR